MCNQAFVDTIGHQNFLKQACNMNVIKGRCTVPTGESITYPFVDIRMKNRKNRKSSSNDKIAWGLILGFMGGLLLDNIALGLVVGLLIGSLPECIEKGKK